MRRVPLILALILFAFAPGVSWGLFGSTEKLTVGSDAPRFGGSLLDGGEFDLGPLIGKKAVLLDFWSIFCVSCVQQMPKLVETSNRYPDQLVVVGIDLDSFGTKRVMQFIKGLDFKVTYPIVLDKTRQVAAKYGVSVLPTAVLIDKQGKILYYHVGYAPGDEAEIDDMVKKAVSSK